MNKKVASILQEYRTEKHLTWAEISLHIGISMPTYCKLEKGLRVSNRVVHKTLALLDGYKDIAEKDFHYD